MKTLQYAPESHQILFGIKSNPNPFGGMNAVRFFVKNNKESSSSSSSDSENEIETKVEEKPRQRYDNRAGGSYQNRPPRDGSSYENRPQRDGGAGGNY